MFVVPKRSPPLLVAGAVTLALLSSPWPALAEPSASHARYAAVLEAEFRGCDAAGWCRFRIESLDSPSGLLYRVRPNGVISAPCEGAACVAVRDRLNALLSNMIHQAKRIELRDLRELGDGTFAATVTVNGQAVASDPILVELREGRTGTIR